ncbi:MAG: terpene cyclase/mutase family protein [Pirellulales bacterium]|nr:terpene cyclase/mutase family protein [Pirellulales bacterium]
MLRRLLLMLPIFIVCTGSMADEPKAPVKTSPLAEQGPRPKPVPAPSSAEIDASLKRGIEFLLAHQNKNGSWGSIDIFRPGEIYAPVPGSHHAFRAAVTAMDISALIETGQKDPRVVESLDRAEAWLFENLPHVRRATPDCFYNVWTHIYSLQALAKMLGRKPDDARRAEKIRAQIRQQLDLLDRYEVVDGGWAYYDFDVHSKKPAGSSISFVTAAVLVAFKEVQDIGEQPPRKLIDRGIASILRQRRPDYTYCYGEYLKYMNHPVNQPGGSLGRSQACNYAMRIWGDKTVSDAIVKNWLDRLYARNGWLDIGRKRPIPHESWFAVAGYFFYFGHYYGARCIELLPESERGPYQDQMAHILLALQEKDGSWWDYPMYNYHQAYGTAYALMSLNRCQRAAAGIEPKKD